MVDIVSKGSFSWSSALRVIPAVTRLTVNRRLQFNFELTLPRNELVNFKNSESLSKKLLRNDIDDLKTTRRKNELLGPDFQKWGQKLKIF